MAEIQVHLHDVLKLSGQEHKLYEVVRANSIDELLHECGAVTHKVHFSTPRKGGQQQGGGPGTLKRFGQRIRRSASAFQRPKLHKAPKQVVVKAEVGATAGSDANGKEEAAQTGAAPIQQPTLGKGGPAELNLGDVSVNVSLGEMISEESTALTLYQIE